MCGESSPDDGGEHLSGVDVGGGKSSCGCQLANDSQDGDYHGLL